MDGLGRDRGFLVEQGIARGRVERTASGVRSAASVMLSPAPSRARISRTMNVSENRG